MEYYYGKARVMGKNIDIRVKPEMITDGIVAEIELYLLVKVSSGFNPVKTYGWHKKHSRHDTPACGEFWAKLMGRGSF